MADKKTILKQIESVVQARRADWRVGSTANATETKARSGNPLDWLQWQADSADDASEIVESLVAGGVKRSRLSGPGRTVFILKA